MLPKDTLINLENITVRLRDRTILEDSSWEIKKDQQWAIVGPNGSGKSTLVKALWGGVTVCRGKIKGLSKDQIGYVSFELHQNLLNQEDFADAMREYAGKEEEFTSCKDVITSAVKTPKESECQKIAKQCQIEHLLSENIRHLSTGEMRKTLIARALMKKPKLLILDEPFDGLDEPSRQTLKKAIDNLIKENINIVLIAHRLDEISPLIQNVLLISEGQILKQGKKADVLTEANLSKAYDCNLKVKAENGTYKLQYAITTSKKLPESKKGQIIVELKNISVNYGSKVIFEDFNFKMQASEKVAILGPNGSGKSTIVKLITGEHMQGYSNQVFVFGEKRGSNKSIWQIKKNMGIISSEVQVSYRKSMNALDVICSGFYDSIGLYKRPTPKQEETAEKWAKTIKISHLLDKNFAHMSYGQKRLVLLARAIVKKPKLLILDEPCHGLDVKNRANILQIIQNISEDENFDAAILFITHHKDEILPCISRTVKLKCPRSQEKKAPSH
jgi:molybdate transport system ATP-binding protein